jgi:IclR family KDG regulon transcriptional repressor
MKDSTEYNVRAVERALDILNCFDDEHTERGITEIAQAANLHKATAHRIVATLVNYHFLDRAPDGQKYRLGLQLTDLGYKVVRRMNLRNEAYPYMVELVKKWDETVDLSVFDQGAVFYLEMVPGNHALTIAAAIGRRLPIQCTAAGKIFLAFLPASEQEVFLNQLLPHITANTITSPEALRQQLAQIRQQGYSLDDEELEEGIRAIASPIRNHEGKVVAAISMPCPSSRLTLDLVPQVAQNLIEITQAISQRLGWKK